MGEHWSADIQWVGQIAENKAEIMIVWKQVLLKQAMNAIPYQLAFLFVLFDRELIKGI